MVMAVRTSTLVLPAAIVTEPPETFTQAAPSKYCSALVAPVSVPTVALPLLSVGVKLMAPALAVSRETVNTAYGEASLTVTLLTETVGAEPAAKAASVKVVATVAFLLSVPVTVIVWAVCAVVAVPLKVRVAGSKLMPGGSVPVVL